MFHVLDTSTQVKELLVLIEYEIEHHLHMKSKAITVTGGAGL
jgi:hypothetical protein